MSKNQTTNNSKSLKEYFLEFKKISTNKRIWLILDDNTNVNIKLDYKFFIHMIGIQKIPIYRNLSINQLIKKIINEQITFTTINKNIRTAKLKDKNNKHNLMFVKNKITGLKLLSKIDINSLVFYFPFFSFDKNNINKSFINFQSDFMWFNVKNNTILGFLLAKIDGKNNFDNYCYFKSFVLIKFKKCCMLKGKCKHITRNLFNLNSKKIVKITLVNE